MIDPSPEELDSRGREVSSPKRKGPVPMDRRAAFQDAHEGRSKYRGVSWHFDRCRWQIHIRAGGTQFHIGERVSQIESAEAYDDARYWLQDFSRTRPQFNFPDRSFGPPSNRVLTIRARLTEDGLPRYEHDPSFHAPALTFDSSGTIKPMKAAPKIEPDESFRGPFYEWREALAADFEGTESELREAILKDQPAWLAEQFPSADKIKAQLELLSETPKFGVEARKWRISKR